MKKTQFSFAVTSAIFCSLFFMATNYMTTDYIWCIYPIYAIMFWPLGVYLFQSKNIKRYSVIGSLLTIGMLTFCNLYTSSGHFWFLYIVLPMIWWPVCIGMGSRALSFGFTLFSFLMIGSSYVLLNIFYSPGHPWSIYVLYVLIWFPLLSYFHGKYKSLTVAVIGTIIHGVFFTVVNAITSPHTIWAVYPIFAILWWPLSVYYFVTKPQKMLE